MDRNTSFKIDLQLFAKGNETVVPEKLRQQAWASQTWTTAMIEQFFAQFTGKSSDNIIQLDDTMKKEAGDQITFKLRMPLLGDGTEGDDVLEGNEEAMEYHDFQVVINQGFRHAVRIKGKMEEKKTSTRMRTEAKDALVEWFAEQLTKRYFNKLSANPSSRRIVFPTGVGNGGGITAAHTMSCALISKAKRKAKKRIVYTDAEGKKHVVPKIRPVKVKGKSYYVLILTEEQIRDLQNDPVWIQAQQHANVRGEENPLFTGAEGVWSGVAIFSHDFVKVTNDGNAGTNVGHALFLGAQAACFAVGSNPEWEEEEFDFKNKVAFETGQIFGIEKSVFDGEDLAVMHIYAASVEDN